MERYLYIVTDFNEDLIMTATSMPEICQKLKVSHDLVSKRLNYTVNKNNVFRKDPKFHFNIDRVDREENYS